MRSYEVFPAEGCLDDVWWDLAEPGVVDLAAVREQRGTLAIHDAGDVHRGRDPLLRFEHPALIFLAGVPVGDLDTLGPQRVPDQLPVAAPHRGQVELGRDAGSLHRGDSGPASVHVIGMLVEAVRIVGDHHLRPVLLDQPADPASYLVDRYVAERFWPLVILPLGHA